MVARRDTNLRRWPVSCRGPMAFLTLRGLAYDGRGKLLRSRGHEVSGQASKPSYPVSRGTKRFLLVRVAIFAVLLGIGLWATFFRLDSLSGRTLDVLATLVVTFYGYRAYRDWRRTFVRTTSN